MSDETTQQPEQAPKRRRSVPGAVPQAEAPEVVPVDDGLPNAIDIDARTITGPVLTKQGWVVPDEAHLAKLRKVAELQRELKAL